MKHIYLFTTSGCAACGPVAEILESLCERPGLRFEKFSADDGKEGSTRARYYKVSSVPHVVFIEHDGTPVHVLIGGKAEETYRRAVENFMKVARPDAGGVR